MSRNCRVPIPIVIADDDEEDRMLARDALAECRLANELYFVRDGEELMDFLLHRNAYADPASSPRPGLILLDLRMPRKDGFEVLREIRGDGDLRVIPIVVLTTSTASDDVLKSYQLGVNSFITKPVTFAALVEAMKVLGRYWFEIVEIPAPAQMEERG